MKSVEQSMGYLTCLRFVGNKKNVVCKTLRLTKLPTTRAITITLPLPPFM